MTQLRALLWLKWTIMRRDARRSRKAAASGAASALLFAGAALLSLLAASALGAATYFLALSADRATQQVSLCVMIFTVYFMWATIPLGGGGGDRFDPGRLLIYPIGLPKLFALDFAGGLFNLSAIFAAPALCGIALGVGLARGGGIVVARSLSVGFVAAFFGLALVKCAELLVSELLRRGRTRGETIVALLGVALGLGGALVGQILPRLEGIGRVGALPWYVRWSPPGALAAALTADGTNFLAPLAATTLAGILCVRLSYHWARRSITGGGGGKSSRARFAPAAVGASSGWRLPLLSAQTGAVFEKELRYAWRNAQLRALSLMPLVLTIAFRLIRSDAEADVAPALRRLSAGVQPAGSVFYVFVIISTLSVNLFAFEGAGMRALILSPASRRRVLLGKNLAVLAITLLLSAIALAFNALFGGELTVGSASFACLCFAFWAPLFAAGGNQLSLLFPRRLEYGRRLRVVGVSVLLLIPLWLLALAPPTLAVAVDHLAGDDRWRYVIIGASALISAAFYLSVIGGQGRALEKRELDVLAAVTKEGGD